MYILNVHLKYTLGCMENDNGFSKKTRHLYTRTAARECL